LPVDDLAIDQARERDLLAAAVREAGALALTFFRTSPKQWPKGESSVVCEADIAVDDFLRRRLAREGYGWLSEETEDDPARLNASQVWIVDPIDGTRSYLAGRADWAVSAALVVAGRPVVAALFVPVSEELFLATAGGGSTCNAVPIKASAGDRLDGARIAGPKRMFDLLAQLKLNVDATPRIGSLALRIARVAQGELDASFAGGASHDWDLAAADLLVHEAGGALTTLTGDALIYNMAKPMHASLVAAGRARHATLIDLLHQAQNDRS
jgi:myo-inositol-1(or 4)-monophosphatase